MARKPIQVDADIQERFKLLCESMRGLQMGGVVEAFMVVALEHPDLLPLLMGHLQSPDLKDVYIKQMLEELRGSRGSPANPKSEGEATRKSASNAAG